MMEMGWLLWFFMFLGVAIAAALAFFAISKAVSRRKLPKHQYHDENLDPNRNKDL